MTNSLTFDKGVSLDEIFSKIDDTVTLREKYLLIKEIRNILHDLGITLRTDLLLFSMNSLIDFQVKLLARYRKHYDLTTICNSELNLNTEIDFDSIPGFKVLEEVQPQLPSPTDSGVISLTTDTSETLSSVSSEKRSFTWEDVERDIKRRQMNGYWELIKVESNLDRKVERILADEILPSFTGDEYDRITDEQTDLLNNKFGNKDDPYPFGYCNLVNFHLSSRVKAKSLIKRIMSPLDLLEVIRKNSDLRLKPPHLDVWHYSTSSGIGHFTDNFTDRGNYESVEHASAASIVAHGCTMQLNYAGKFKSQNELSLYYNKLVAELFQRSGVIVLPSKGIDFKAKRSRSNMQRNGGFKSVKLDLPLYYHNKMKLARSFERVLKFKNFLRLKGLPEQIYSNDDMIGFNVPNDYVIEPGFTLNDEIYDFDSLMGNIENTRFTVLFYKISTKFKRTSNYEVLKESDFQARSMV